MRLRKLAPFLLAIVFWCCALPARAFDYAPPLSYSNAELAKQDFSNQVLRGAEFSNANMEEINFANSDLRGAVLSASVMRNANLHAADLTYAMIDQVNFTNADLSDAVLIDSILLRSIFKDTDITGVDFTNAILDGAQIKELCQKASGVNSKTGVATRDSLGCS